MNYKIKIENEKQAEILKSVCEEIGLVTKDFNKNTPLFFINTKNEFQDFYTGNLGCYWGSFGGEEISVYDFLQKYASERYHDIPMELIENGVRWVIARYDKSFDYEERLFAFKKGDISFCLLESHEERFLKLSKDYYLYSSLQMREVPLKKPEEENFIEYDQLLCEAECEKRMMMGELQDSLIEFNKKLNSKEEKKIQYTAETFPFWAVWIRKKNGERESVRQVLENGINSNLMYKSEVSYDFKYIHDIEIAGTDGRWYPFYRTE